MAPKLRSSLDGIGDDFRAIIEEMKKQLIEMKSEMTNLNYLLVNKCREIDNLTADVASLRQKVSNSKNLLTMRTRMFDGRPLSLMVLRSIKDVSVKSSSSGRGFTSSPGELCNNIIRNVIKEKLKISLQPSDISVAHRAGKKPSTQGPDRRGIQVRFCRRDTKREIMLTKRDNKDPNATLYTSESLTPKRSTLFFTLRQMKKKCPELVRGCTSQEGRVFAFTPSAAAASSTPARDRKHLINSYYDLVQFCRDFVKVPLDTFLTSWEH